MREDIKQTWFFDQPQEEVWEYLTQPELIEQWLMKTEGFKPVVGNKFRFTFTAKPGSIYEGVVHCEVLEVNPCNLLSYTWNGRTKNQSREFNSIVVWTLVPKGGGTELQLQHNGFTVLRDIINHGKGWDGCIKRLKELLDTIKK